MSYCLSHKLNCLFVIIDKFTGVEELKHIDVWDCLLANVSV